MTKTRRVLPRSKPAHSQSAQPSKTRAKKPPWPISVGALIFLLLAGALLWSQRGRAPRSAPHAELPIAALTDSQRAAINAGNWPKAVRFAELLIDREPKNPLRWIGLSLAWHNLAWVGESYARPRSSTRTSLDRIRMELHGLALLDSAMTLARHADDVARIRHWVAQVYEDYGLPVDAISGYLDAIDAVPGFSLSMPRVRWLAERLNDPVGKSGP